MEANLKDEGFATARSAMQIAPTEIENVLWYSDFMSEHENAREAIQILKDTIHLMPEEKALYLTLARTYVNLNQIEDTKETLNRMLALEDIETEEYVNVANLYLHLNEADEASRIIKKAISDNPSPDFAESRDLIYSVLKLGDSAAALQLISDLEPAPSLIRLIRCSNRTCSPPINSSCPHLVSLKTRSTGSSLRRKRSEVLPAMFPKQTRTTLPTTAQGSIIGQLN